MVSEVKAYPKDRASIMFALKENEVNTMFGIRKWIMKSLSRCASMEVTSKSSAPYDYEKAMAKAMKIMHAQYLGDYTKALELIDGMEISIYSPKEIQITNRLAVYVGKGDYDNARKLAESLQKSKGYEMASYSWLFNINAFDSKPEAALENYEKYLSAHRKLGMPDSLINNSDMTNFNFSLIDISQKKYGSAVDRLKTSIQNRSSKKEWLAYTLAEAWRVYKALGDAYLGLDQKGKAKDAYNIALFYYPEFQPAIDALADLEVKIATDQATDKTAPVITLTEPAAQRGFKPVASTAEVVVKGIAKDASGIKSVSINGNEVFKQDGGIFWGNVTLQNGLNTITIKAVDLAGNAAENKFEIEYAVTAKETISAKEGKNYCLLLAAQNYADPAIPSLDNPIPDAVKLKIILKNKYNFSDENVISLFNPDANEVQRQLLELTNIIQPEDNLVIFYAGHGIWVDKEKRGYWLLTDAKRNDPNTWLQNKVVLDLIAKLPSRHTLLITDACFSGSVFKTRGLSGSAPVAIQAMQDKISRVAITSGNDTEVPDESVFMKYLVKALSENSEKYLTAQKLFINNILEAVMTESKTEPRYGTLELAGHIGGDFVFEKK
jgi:tetratricopeptide (TPR) repeat protein